MAFAPNTVTVNITPDMISALESVKGIIKDALLKYTEWLDNEQGLIREESEDDDRSWSELVDDFLAEAE